MVSTLAPALQVQVYAPIGATRPPCFKSVWWLDVSRIVTEELTDKQRQAVDLLAVQGLPIETVASRMQVKPNALYKLMFDARVRIKSRLEREGLTPAQILSVFEGGAG
jgi:hypothetical protein